MLPVAPSLVPAAPFSAQLSKDEILEQRIRDSVKGVFFLGVALFLGPLSQRAFHNLVERELYSDRLINLYAGVFLGLYAIAASSLAYQSYLRVTEPDPIQKPAAARPPQR